MNKKKLLFELFLIAQVFLTGCVTSIAFQVERPPALNTLGIQRLAVMPYSTTDYSSLQRQAAVWLTNESLLRIQRINHFKLISSSEIERMRAAKENIESIADALFSGQVLSTTVKDTTSQSTRRNKDGDNVSYTIYNREVQISFNYFLTRVRDGSLIGPVNKSLSTNISAEQRSDITNAETLIQDLIQNSLSGLNRDIAPYRTIERRNLMKEESSDKIVKQRAKDAEVLAKEGSYKNALNAFMGIYQDTGSFAAGYNACLFLEAQGDLEGAAEFMQKVYIDTSNPQAISEIARLQRAMATAGLLEAYKRNQSQRDRVIADMINTLPNKMPNNPRVAFVNNSLNERDLAETIVNGILEGLLAKKITVVERNSRILLEMEKNYQYSGNVSEEEMVRIGREAGVNTFILVSVTGSGSSRRLSLRMLDVERNTVLYQSPQTNEMNL